MELLQAPCCNLRFIVTAELGSVIAVTNPQHYESNEIH